MTPAVTNTSFDSRYTGAKPSLSNTSTPSLEQHQSGALCSHLPSTRTRSLALNLNSSLPTMTPKFSSASALKPSPLSPKDPNFIDSFCDSFYDDCDQIDDSQFILGAENIPPTARVSSDVSCTAVFRAGGVGDAQLTVMNTNTTRKKPLVTSPVANKGWKLPFANRKRIIDEIYEHCDDEVGTPPCAKKCFSMHSVANVEQTGMRLDENVLEDVWKVEESVQKKPSKATATNRIEFDQSHGGCDFPSLIYGFERKGCSNERDSQPSLARKLALKSGSAESAAVVQQMPSPRQAKKLTVASLGGYRGRGGEEHRQLSPVKNMCTLRGVSRSCDQESTHKSSQCSFFTTGPTRLNP